MWHDNCCFQLWLQLSQVAVLISQECLSSGACCWLIYDKLIAHCILGLMLVLVCLGQGLPFISNVLPGRSEPHIKIYFLSAARYYVNILIETMVCFGDFYLQWDSKIVFMQVKFLQVIDEFVRIFLKKKKLTRASGILTLA